LRLEVVLGRDLVLEIAGQRILEAVVVEPYLILVEAVALVLLFCGTQ
jgi:hypothetical protein